MVTTPNSSSDDNGSGSTRKMKKKKLIDFNHPILRNLALLCFGYALCWINCSLIVLLLLFTTTVFIFNAIDERKTSNFIKAKAKACVIDKIDWLDAELPPWVKFPDKERALWLNQVLELLWPTISLYITKLLRTSVQAQIQKKYEKFRFENVDMGCNPPKIDGIKVYNINSGPQDSIIIDFELNYDGNCDVDCSISGTQVGGINNFQFSSEMRLILKPLLNKMPLVGGIQVFFLNTPQMTFSLDGLSNIPGLNYFIRLKIEEQFQKRMVFPNKFTKRFSKAIDPSELKALEPYGVLRVHLAEAKNLMAKDITGKSDPYVIISVGAQQFRSPTINQNLNPQWDFWCEFIVGDPHKQSVRFTVYDHDNVNEDDYLGCGSIDIQRILRGRTDTWYTLDEAKHGKIHLRFTWLTLESEPDLLQSACNETKLLKMDSMNSCLLLVFVDSIQNLPCFKSGVNPHAYFTISVNGHNKQKSKVKKHTVNPEWEQGFIFLIPDPKTDLLQMMISDKQSQTNLISFTYEICDLLQHDNMQISKKQIDLNEQGCKLIISLQLKILVKAEIDNDEDFDDDEVSLCSTESEDDVKFPRHSDTIEEKIVQSVNTQANLFASPSSFSINSLKEYHLGQIELTLAFSELRQKLSITVHKICDLPQSDPSDIPDPYVKIKLLPQGHITYRTKKITDDCNPIFEETFEYLASRSDFENQELLFTVKTAKFFSNKTMGEIQIKLRDLNLREPVRKWYDLRPKKEKDKH